MSFNKMDFKIIVFIYVEKNTEKDQKHLKMVNSKVNYSS